MLDDLRFAAHEPVNVFFVLISKVAGVKPSRPDVFGGQFRIMPITRGHTPSVDNHLTDLTGSRNQATGIINQGNFDTSNGSADGTDLFFTIRGIHAVNLQLGHPAAFRNFDAEDSLKPLLDSDGNCFSGRETEIQGPKVIFASSRAVD